MTRSQTSPTLEQRAAQIATRPRPLLLAFDIDGTLAPYHIEPQSARVPPDAVRALRDLANVEHVTVALITGRAFPSMNLVIDLPQAWRSAEHGAVIVAPGARYTAATASPAEKATLAAFDLFVTQELVPSGADYEEKPRARAIHTRAISQRDAALGERLLDQAREKATSLGLHTRDGSFIVEAELDHADKSEALQTIAEQSQAQTIYFAGDDLTDYPAIKLAHQHSELGVFVCSDKRPTPPDDVSFALSDIEQHLTFIKQLADSLGKWPRL